jgi:hypothetical protein
VIPQIIVMVEVQGAPILTAFIWLVSLPWTLNLEPRCTILHWETPWRF